MKRELLRVYKNMIGNRNSEAMNRDMTGHTVEDNSVRINLEDVIAYAAATGDDPERYSSGKAPVPPFFPSVFLAPVYNGFVGHNNLKMNILRMVHWKQEAEWYQPVYPGDELKAVSCISNIYDVPAGEVLELTTQTYRKGDCVQKGVGSFLVVRGGSHERKNSSEADRKVAFTCSVETRKGQNLAYADISGDKNVIHTNRFFAGMAGFPGTIMHGICVTAMVCNSLLDKLAGGDRGRAASLSVSFARPVFPGDSLTVSGYDSPDPGTVAFDVKNEAGRAVLRNGVFQYRQ